jgi:hypothetical protein
VTLDRPGSFEIAPNTGSLKKSVQNGQQLLDKPDDRRFQISNISVAFLREQTGGQVKRSSKNDVYWEYFFSRLPDFGRRKIKRDHSCQRRCIAALPSRFVVTAFWKTGHWLISFLRKERERRV